MVVIPGDRVRIGRAPVVTVAEAYLRDPYLVQIVSTGGRVWWVDPATVRRVECGDRS
ncbi:hypothetical protein Athai_60100 [Actinocatenispora thailandica]|uniref:DUF1918 domain-containing protein n=1 Tax=Actinocatenispora thailandica TaxID=227318 RepID=A0A7R7DW75_9ACTN|nr:hypothetical protein [Actinocatenispora thailandica]BCJ38507.1 hypothetical protein Athai_60100 [Actinocatenispora thailandica]